MCDALVVFTTVEYFSILCGCGCAALLNAKDWSLYHNISKDRGVTVDK